MTWMMVICYRYISNERGIDIVISLAPLMLAQRYYQQKMQDMDYRLIVVFSGFLILLLIYHIERAFEWYGNLTVEIYKNKV